MPADNDLNRISIVCRILPGGYPLLLAGLIWLVLSSSLPAGDYAICAPDGIALGGYDVVSYFAADGPYFGKPEHAAQHNGLTYLFASTQNLSSFEADRKRYLPRYGGWCAATLSMGMLTCPEFTNFKIEDGSLLLFEHSGFTNGRTLWNTNPLEYRQRADQNALQLLDDRFSP